MTLPRKGSRTVQVDGVVYRWTAKSESWPPSRVRLIAHEETLPANSVLDLQVWESHCAVLTPDIVVHLIRGALSRGWQPKSKGTFNIGPDDTTEMLP